MSGLEKLGSLREWLGPERGSSGIYALVCDEGIYVGQSINLESRLRNHASAVYGPIHLASGKMKSSPSGAQKVMRDLAENHGAEFSVVILERPEAHELTEREAHWIRILHALGMNLLNRGPDGDALTDWIERGYDL